jgi:magnesium chelatase family protein
MGSLLATLDFLRQGGKSAARRPASVPVEDEPEADLAEVKGQEQAKRALEVAAAGGHNFLMVGTPGCGKTMLARRLPSILPPMSREEVLETTRVHSAAGLLQGGRGIQSRRPFRSPHHSISAMALLGGGGAGRPGELSLAHNGVLFLDEFPEFRRDAVEALRQPLEEGHVTISRVGQNLDFPCRVMLGSAMNSCPCGRLGDTQLVCRCRLEEISRYRARISGPLLDRIDIQMEMGSLSYGEVSGTAPAEPSSVVRARVLAAREMQARRFRTGSRVAGVGTGRRKGSASGSEAPASGDGIRCNAQMTGAQLARHCVLGREAGALLKDALTTLGFSARAYDRILKVARTVADLEGATTIGAEHIAESIHYRALDRDHQPMG